MRKTKLNLNKIVSKNVSPEKALKRAQMGVLAKEPFIATVMLNLKHNFSDKVPTAAANKLEVLYNPEFFMKLDPQEQIFLIAHEAWHVALQHGARLGHRDSKLWNQAADFVINYILTDQNIGSRPQGGLYQQAFANMSTEQVYEQLENLLETSGVTHRSDLFGEDITPPSNDLTQPIQSPKLSPQEQMKLDEILIRAKDEAVKQKQWGNAPGHLKDLLDDITSPKHNWKEQLRAFVTERTKNDYSWRRPNRRTPPDIYIPSLYSENPRCVVIAVDTSGSISNEELNTFMSEIRAIHEDTRPVKTHIIGIDTKVHDEYEYDGTEYIPKQLSFGGRGGTEFQPAFDWAEDKNPSCLIYLTDLYASDPDNPAYPTLWVSTTKDKHGPFGTTIYLDCT